MIVKPKFKQIEDSGLDETDIQRQIKMHGGDPLRKLKVDYCIVFTIRFGNLIEYGLDLEPEGSLPIFYQSELFEVVDDRLSKYWVYSSLNFNHPTKTGNRNVMLTFPEWAHNANFFDLLVNSDEGSWKTWRNYKSLMEVEFATPDIVHKAENVGEGWVLCAECSNGWKTDDNNNEIIKCPSCGLVQTVDRENQYRFTK